MTIGMTGGVMPVTITDTIFDMTVVIPTENGKENVPSSEIYFENSIEKNLVDYNSFSTQVSSFYNDLEFEKRSKSRDLYNAESLKRLSKNQTQINNQTSVTSNLINQSFNASNVMIISPSMRYSYPSPNATSGIRLQSISTTFSSTPNRFSYPSVK